MSTHARPLADHLAAASDDELTVLLSARGVRPDAGWQDFFDAAEALLEPSSIARVLPALTAAEATTLLDAASGSVVGAERERLVALALLRPDGTPHPPVAEAVAGKTRPAVPDDTPAPASSESVAAHAAERAFTTVGAVADILLLARDQPVALLMGGAVSAGQKRQLADAGLPVESVDPL
ncbi:unnamed protein product, partial [Penicillium discolor]